MPTEIEARFRADDAEALERLTAIPRLGPAALGSPVAVDEVDVYLDTPDGAFAAGRWAVRLRSRSGTHRISLKGTAQADGAGDAWLHQRPELEGPATAETDPGAWPASAARDLVTSMNDGAPLVERFTLVQRRTERSVHVDGRPLGTLTLDAVRVEHRGRHVGTLHVVELELAAEGTGRDGRQLLERLAVELDAIEGLTPEPRTKLERAVALIEVL